MGLLLQNGRESMPLSNGITLSFAVRVVCLSVGLSVHLPCCDVPKICSSAFWLTSRSAQAMQTVGRDDAREKGNE